MQAVKDFLRGNWKLILTVLIAIGGSGAVTFSKGDKLEIHIILPEDADFIFGTSGPVKLSGAGLSHRGQLAIRTAAVQSRRSAEGEELYTVLKRLYRNPDLIEDALSVAKSGEDSGEVHLTVKLAARTAIAILYRTEPAERSDLDNQLLELAKLFESRAIAVRAVFAAIDRQ
jgi:hypothetical protein